MKERRRRWGGWSRWRAIVLCNGRRLDGIVCSRWPAPDRSGVEEGGRVRDPLQREGSVIARCNKKKGRAKKTARKEVQGYRRLSFFFLSQSPVESMRAEKLATSQQHIPVLLLFKFGAFALLSATVGILYATAAIISQNTTCSVVPST